jgi:hypothetical protein
MLGVGVGVYRPNNALLDVASPVNSYTSKKVDMVIY